MTALYTKYKESGLTRGEIRKKSAKQKLAGAPMDLSYVDQFYDRLYLQDSTALTADQKASLTVTLTKLRNMVLQKMKQLKV